MLGLCLYTQMSTWNTLWADREEMGFCIFLKVDAGYLKIQLYCFFKIIRPKYVKSSGELREETKCWPLGGILWLLHFVSVCCRTVRGRRMWAWGQGCHWLMEHVRIGAPSGSHLSQPRSGGSTWGFQIQGRRTLGRPPGKGFPRRWAGHLEQISPDPTRQAAGASCAPRPVKWSHPQTTVSGSENCSSPLLLRHRR